MNLEITFLLDVNRNKSSKKTKVFIFQKGVAMALRTVMFLYAATLCIGLTSCQKLVPDEAALKATRQLKIETLKSLDAIPADMIGRVCKTVRKT